MQRISAKLYVEDSSAVTPTALIPVFHRWISDGAVEGLLIDVADYKHVPEGPGIMLIGHEGDYSVEYTDGVPAFRYERKRDRPSELREQIHQVLRLTLIGANTLAETPDPHGPIGFRTDEVVVSIADRLRAANTAENFESIKHEVEAAVAEIYGAVVETVEHISEDARVPLGFRVRIDKAPALNELAGRVQTAAAS